MFARVNLRTISLFLTRHMFTGNTNKGILGMLVLISTAFSKLEIEDIESTFLEVFKEDPKSARSSIFNPLFGSIFQAAGAVENIRLYGPGITIKENNGKRKHADDKSNDAATNLTILLFPSPSSGSTDVSTDDDSFASLFDKDRDGMIRYTASMFMSILTGASHIDTSEKSEYVNKACTLFEEYSIIKGKSTFKDKDVQLMIIHAFIVDFLNSKEDLAKYLKIIRSGYSEYISEVKALDFDIFSEYKRIKSAKETPQYSPLKKSPPTTLVKKANIYSLGLHVLREYSLHGNGSKTRQNNELVHSVYFNGSLDNNHSKKQALTSILNEIAHNENTGQKSMDDTTIEVFEGVIENILQSIPDQGIFNLFKPFLVYRDDLNIHEIVDGSGASIGITNTDIHKLWEKRMRKNNNESMKLEIWEMDEAAGFTNIFNFLESTNELRNLRIVLFLNIALTENYLYEGLKKLRNLTSLDISDWNDNLYSENLSDTFGYLKKLTTLKLDMSCFGSRKEILTILEKLSKLTSLKDLKLKCMSFDHPEAAGFF